MIDQEKVGKYISACIGMVPMAIVAVIICMKQQKNRPRRR